VSSWNQTRQVIASHTVAAAAEMLKPG